jgi:hypothetical protein
MLASANLGNEELQNFGNPEGLHLFSLMWNQQNKE